MTIRRANLGNESTTLSLPPFRGAVRALILISTAIYVVILLLSAFAPTLFLTVLRLGLLSRDPILNGWVWQFGTYGFVNVDPLDFVLSMLGVYFLGTAVEMQIGPRHFVRLYLSSLVIAGGLGFLLSLTKVVGSGAAGGPGAAANAILMVFFLLNPHASIIPIPIPISIPVRYIVIVTVFIEGAYLLLSRFGLNIIVLLCGLVAGWAWFALQMRAPRSSRTAVGRGLSDRGFTARPASAGGPIARMRNAYYRWKRRRAAKKFEVYMRQHDRDVRFDDSGHYVPPAEEPKKGNGGDGKGGWVN